MAVGHLLHSAGCSVTIWEHNAEDYRSLITTRTNPGKLGEFELHHDIGLTDNLAAAVEQKDVVVAAIPSQHLRSVIKQIKGPLGAVPAFVNLAKGVERESLKRMSEVVFDETGLSPDRYVTLSGPSHAEEVVQDMPTTVVAASRSDDRATLVQELFSVGHFRVYKSDDVVGVELGGALKNIIAIAAGIVDGLGMGDNTKGALITRGLAEITRLGLAMDARADTFAGLSGIGDLITTCFSRHSRNRHVGEQIGRGKTLDEVLASMSMVAEGIETARSGRELARRHRVEVPITEQVYQVLFDGKPARQAVGELMERKLRAELWQ